MDKMQNVEKWVSMDFITEYLDTTRESVLKWIAIRDMPAHKVGRQWKFKASEVDEWIRSGGAADKTDTNSAEASETEHD
jgi:excisionase family DNA binding protein